MSCAFPTLFPTGDADSRNTLNRKMSCPKVDMTPAASCRSVNHTLTHREANALELALSRSRSPHNAPHSPSIYYNWASVSEPHTCDFNATFSLYIYMLSICDRHCTSNIAINISIFHLGLIRGARAYCPDAERSAPPIVEATAHRGRAVNLRACALAV